jgi:hypothetical protein
MSAREEVTVEATKGVAPASKREKEGSTFYEILLKSKAAYCLGYDYIASGRLPYLT